MQRRDCQFSSPRIKADRNSGMVQEPNLELTNPEMARHRMTDQNIVDTKPCHVIVHILIQLCGIAFRSLPGLEGLSHTKSNQTTS